MRYKTNDSSCENHAIFAISYNLLLRYTQDTSTGSYALDFYGIYRNSLKKKDYKN